MREPHTRHPHALTLALLIASFQRFGDLEEKTHDVIAHATDLADYSDERKADLYARIVEKVTAAMRVIDLEQAINSCLWANERRFYGG